MNLQMPHNAEAEAAVLGAVMIDPRAINTLSLAADDFYIGRNRTIYETMRRVDASGAEIDLVTVSDALTAAGKMSEVGLSYLIGLTNQVPTSLHIKHYAEIVAEAAMRRRVIEAASGVVRAAYALDTPMDDAIGHAITALVTNVNGTSGAVPISEYASELWDEVQERSANPRDIFGTVTGMPSFDRITGGLQTGEVMILSGEPGLGKTMLATQLCVGMAEHGAPGAIYEMEMRGRQVVRRMLSAHARVPVREMRSGRLQDGAWEKIAAGIEHISNLPIYMSDSTDWTTTRLRADIARLKERAGIRWVMVDYLDLLADKPESDPNERSRFISGQMHHIMKDLDVAGLVIHSMNKGGIAGTAGKASLSGSAKVIYDADGIAILTCPDDTVPQNLSLRWTKNREGDGENGFINLRRVNGFPAFVEVTQEVRR